jgi:hypothetical protein
MVRQTAGGAGPMGRACTITPKHPKKTLDLDLKIPL